MSSDQVVRVLCPNLACKKVLAVPALARGKTVVCRGCNTRIRVPAKPGDKGAGSGAAGGSAKKAG